MTVGDRDYLVGDCLTMADILAGHTLSWAKSAKLNAGSCASLLVWLADPSRARGTRLAG